MSKSSRTHKRPYARTRMPPAGAELILKEQFIVDETGSRPVAIPELLVLGNASGLRYLSRVFAQIARTPAYDVLNHEHLGRNDPPFAVTLSDDIELRVCKLEKGIRTEMLRYHSISPGNRRTHGLVDRFRHLITCARAEERRSIICQRLCGLKESSKRYKLLVRKLKTLSKPVR